jgi:hypothetical protein
VISKSAATDVVHTLAPSDLTFLLNECFRCFYNKVALHSRRPSQQMPKVFTILDRHQKEFFHGRKTSEIHASLPSGTVDCGDASVMSVPIEVPGSESRIQFRGSIDTALHFDDGTHGIVDFKTADPRDDHVDLYWLQLQCYALALEQPAFGKRELTPITALGLLCFEPDEMVQLKDRMAYTTTPTWVPVKRDDRAFLSLMGLVCSILDNPTPPKPGSKCQWCAWLAANT